MLPNNFEGMIHAPNHLEGIPLPLTHHYDCSDTKYALEICSDTHSVLFLLFHALEIHSHIHFFGLLMYSIFINSRM